MSCMNTLSEMIQFSLSFVVDGTLPFPMLFVCNGGSYLADKIYKRPVIIYEYPKEVKPFYVRVRDDGKIVSSFDVIVPKAGVLVRGSQREERIQELGLPQELDDWYLDLRRHGTVKHSGFHFVFEKMVMFATSLDDIRDTIAFPRTHGSANT